MADKGRRALHKLRDYGITLPPGNRLERATEMIGRTLDQDLPDASIAGEAARTVLDFYLVTHAQSDPLAPPALEKVLQAVVGGDLPLTDQDRAARNVQFELVVWGIFRIGGFEAWFEEPPDIVAVIAAEELGVAAKRLWSLDQAHKRLSDGARQILESGRRGIVATNVQEYLSARALTSNQTDVNEKGQAFDADLRRMHGQMPYLARKEQVFGLLLTGTGFADRPASLRGKRPFDLSTFTQFWGFTDANTTPEAARAFEEMGHALARWHRDWL